VKWFDMVVDLMSLGGLSSTVDEWLIERAIACCRLGEAGREWRGAAADDVARDSRSVDATDG
jgi:hypothetical protein